MVVSAQWLCMAMCDWYKGQIAICSVLVDACVCVYICVCECGQHMVVWHPSVQ